MLRRSIRRRAKSAVCSAVYMKERTETHIIGEDVGDVEKNPPSARLLLAESAEGSDCCECMCDEGVFIDAEGGDVGEQLLVGFVLAEVEGVAEGNDFRLICMRREV